MRSFVIFLAVATVAFAQATRPADPTTQPSARTPHPAPKSGEVASMPIRDLGNFEYDSDAADAAIPADVQAFDGVVVRLNGYMIPLDQAENISRFALVPTPGGCCLVGAPQIQHTIIVKCPKGKAVQYTSGEIVVEGKLAVGPIKDDGYTVGIFALEPTSVKPVAP